MISNKRETMRKVFEQRNKTHRGWFLDKLINIYSWYKRTASFKKGYLQWSYSSNQCQKCLNH